MFLFFSCCVSLLTANTSKVFSCSPKTYIPKPHILLTYMSGNYYLKACGWLKNSNKHFQASFFHVHSFKNFLFTFMHKPQTLRVEKQITLSLYFVCFLGRPIIFVVLPNSLYLRTLKLEVLGYMSNILNQLKWLKSIELSCPVNFILRIFLCVNHKRNSFYFLSLVS